MHARRDAAQPHAARPNTVLVPNSSTTVTKRAAVPVIPKLAPRSFFLLLSARLQDTLNPANAIILAKALHCPTLVSALHSALDTVLPTVKAQLC